MKRFELGMETALYKNKCIIIIIITIIIMFDDMKTSTARFKYAVRYIIVN